MTANSTGSATRREDGASRLGIGADSAAEPLIASAKPRTDPLKARDTARKAKTAAIVTLKAMVITLPRRCGNRLTGSATKRSSNAAPPTGPAASTRPRSAKHALRALARRWVALDAEVAGHDRELDRLTTLASPGVRDGFGIGADSAAELLIVFGDNPERIQTAFANSRHLPHPLRGGHRQANAALYRVVIVPMRFHQPTIDYVARRSAEGLTKKDIIRCLKRFVGREA